jgi:hypothetical protein
LCFAIKFCARARGVWAGVGGVTVLGSCEGLSTFSIILNDRFCL